MRRGDLTDPRAPEVLVGLARDMAKELRQHRLSVPDAARVLFDSPAEPTVAQVRTFISSALDNFAPGAILSLGALESQCAQPVTIAEPLQRAFGRPLERFFGVFGG